MRVPDLSFTIPLLLTLVLSVYALDPTLMTSCTFFTISDQYTVSLGGYSSILPGNSIQVTHPFSSIH